MCSNLQEKSSKRNCNFPLKLCSRCSRRPVARDVQLIAPPRQAPVPKRFKHSAAPPSTHTHTHTHVRVPAGSHVTYVLLAYWEKRERGLCVFSS